MIDFNTTNAIYLQIADYVSDQIQLGKWLPEGKIPSVRELAVTMEVNPNTVMRSYEYLQQQDIIYTKRGLGFFVHKDAPAAIQKTRKELFLQEELPVIFRKMAMMGIGKPELESRFDEFTRQSKHQDKQQD